MPTDFVVRTGSCLALSSITSMWYVMCVHAWVCACMGVCMHGCVHAWVCACMGVCMLSAMRCDL